MLYSALNFAVGFFGLPIEGKYQQSVTIEADGVGLLYIAHSAAKCSFVVVRIVVQQHALPI